MSLMTDLFVGLPGDAPNYGEHPEVASDRFQAGGLTNIAFEMLWAILLGEPWDVERHALTEAASTDESWTFQFPDAYRAVLERMDARAIQQAAAQWAATEEIAGDAADVLPVVTALVHLAHAARSSNRELFVWTAL